MKAKKMEWNGYEFVLQFLEYRNNGRMALQALIVEDDEVTEPLMMVTVNRPDDFLETKLQVFIKNYSENEGILDVLNDEGIGEIVGNPRAQMPIFEFYEDSLADYLINPKKFLDWL